MEYESDFLKIDLDSYKPLREIVFGTMRNAIIEGDFKPGQRLMEVQLAEQMGVSRTPVREAIRKLELEGLVVMVPRKGAYVAGLSSEDIKEVVEIRAVLEGFAAKQAANNSTDKVISTLREVLINFEKAVAENNVVDLINYDTQFHDVIYKAAKNTRLIQMISSLREQVQRYRVAYFTKMHSMEKVLKEHRKMLEAIKDKNSDLARQIAEVHIATTEELLAVMEGNKSL